ncbi:MAG: polyprenyl synthetase family protein [Anaerolineae bacterium]
MPRSYRRDERQTVDQVLRDLALDESYRRHLLGVLDRGATPSAGGAALADLPYLACRACGGDPDQAVPAGAAWSLMRLSAKLFDDVEDDEVTMAVPQTINAALGLVLAAQCSLASLPRRPLEAGPASAISSRFAEAYLTACGGQHADITAADSVEDLDPDVWLTIARAKSGAFYGWAAWVGAVLGGASESQAESFWRYGVDLGVLLQIADDYDGIWCPDGASDLLTGRPSLPVAYALTAAEPRQKLRLVEGLRRARLGSLEQERAVRADLEGLGAQAFMLVAGRSCVTRALQSLTAADIAEDVAEPLRSLTTDVFPVLMQVDRDSQGR